ncbi:MAG: hypothetical protein ACQEXQ_30120 [Bacillota bacterium]
MIKMIKEFNQILNYWEIWYNESDKEFIIHYGEVGDEGKSQEIGAKGIRNKEKYMKEKALEQEMNGYSYLDEDNLLEVVLQYDCSENVEEDLEKRYEIEDLLNNSLGWTGNGNCDGGDYGSGTMNIFCFVVKQDEAIHTIVNTLNEHNYLSGATIAYCDLNDDNIIAIPKELKGNILKLL